MPAQNELDFEVVDKPLKNLLKAFPNLIYRSWPNEVKPDGGVQLILHSFATVTTNTYESIIWICAEKPDSFGRKLEFVLSIPPLLRALLDQVFTICFLSEDVPGRSVEFFKSGWLEVNEKLTRLEEKHGNSPKWSQFFQTNRALQDRLATLTGLTPKEKSGETRINYWPIPSQMRGKCRNPATADYIEYLYEWFYREFSQEAHLSMPGLIVRGFPLVLAHKGEKSEAELEDHIKRVRSDTVVATLTLTIALLSEIQGILNFPSVSQDLRYLWGTLGAYWDKPSDLYAQRYKNLLL